MKVLDLLDGSYRLRKIKEAVRQSIFVCTTLSTSTGCNGGNLNVYLAYSDLCRPADEQVAASSFPDKSCASSLILEG